MNIVRWLLKFTAAAVAIVAALLLWLYRALPPQGLPEPTPQQQQSSLYRKVIELERQRTTAQADVSQQLAPLLPAGRSAYDTRRALRGAGFTCEDDDGFNLQAVTCSLSLGNDLLGYRDAVVVLEVTSGTVAQVRAHLYSHTS